MRKPGFNQFSYSYLYLAVPYIDFSTLSLSTGMSFLNVGSGTGYFSSLAGYILKKHGINHGIELHEDLVDFSKQSITEFIKYGPGDAREICTPVIIPGNCFQLDQSQMKYDRYNCNFFIFLLVIQISELFSDGAPFPVA